MGFTYELGSDFMRELEAQCARDGVAPKPGQAPAPQADACAQLPASPLATPASGAADDPVENP